MIPDTGKGRVLSFIILTRAVSLFFKNPIHRPSRKKKVQQKPKNFRSRFHGNQNLINVSLLFPSREKKKDSIRKSWNSIWWLRAAIRIFFPGFFIFRGLFTSRHPGKTRQMQPCPTLHDLWLPIKCKPNSAFRWFINEIIFMNSSLSPVIPYFKQDFSSIQGWNIKSRTHRGI